MMLGALCRNQAISMWRKRKTKQYFPCRFMGGVPWRMTITEKKN